MHKNSANKETQTEYSKNKEGSVDRTTSYRVYLLGIMSIFLAFRSYTLDSPKTTALVWFLFPNLSFEQGMTNLSYVGSFVGLGSFLSIFIKKIADKIGRKKILIFESSVITIASLVQLFSDNLIVFIITFIFFNIVANVNIWMIMINEEAPKGKNAIYSAIMFIIGSIGSITYFVIRPFYITNNKEYTIANWKGILYISIISGIIITFLIIFTVKETSAFKFNQINKQDQPLKTIDGLKIIFNKSRKKNYIALLVISALFSISVISGNLLEPYMMNYSEVSSEEFSLICLVGIFGLMFFHFFTGTIADKFGRKKLLVIYSFIYPISVISQYLCASIQVDQIRVIILIILKVLGMASRSGLWILLTIISIEIIPTSVRSVGNSLQIFVMNLIGLISGLILAPLYPIIGIRTIAIIASCFMFTIIPLIILFIPESYNQDLKRIT
ncbi:MAG: MFS transporter [Promethearchaeota archaeon]